MKDSRQYPAPTGPYRVCVNRNAGWRAHRAARLQISVNCYKCEGDKLFAALEWCYYRFGETVLVLSDTLQRHNLNLPGDLAWRQSRIEGDRWLERNRLAINFFSPKIERWEIWLDHPRYAENRAEIDRRINASDYVREELAVFMCQQEKMAADIYAGSTRPEIEMLGLPKWVEIDMVRNKSFQDLNCEAA